MKILLSNKFYYRRGGSEVYTMGLEELLKAKGHEVAIFAMQHPQGMDSVYSKYFPTTVEYGEINAKQLSMLVMRPFGTQEVVRKFNALLDEFNPDVVHLSIVHTQISPVIAEIAYKRGVKVVWTIHDYKMLCPRYDCLRNGEQVCERCFTDKKQVLKNRCMKNSLFASVLAYLEAVKWSKEKLERYTDVFICPSQFMADKMIQGGFDKDKIVSLCNFIDVEKTRKENYEKEDYCCYIGRLSHEKGVKTLIESMSNLPYKLKIIGGGPLQEELESYAKQSNIEFVGYKQWDEIKEIVGKARFLVIPSEWYENNPFSVIEAQCLGTPVLGANIGGIPELIEEGKTGMLFESRNVKELESQIKQMFNTEFDYKKIAEYAQSRYSMEKYYNEIMKIYTNK